MDHPETARRPRDRAARSTPENDRELLSAHGALAQYPGAAAVASADGTVVAANPSAQSFVAAVKAGRCPAVVDLIIRAAAGEAVIEAVAVPGDRGGGNVMELSFLPFESGTVLILGRDLTLDRNLRNVLVESRQRYKDLVEISSDFAWETGPDGAFVFVSPRGALGYSADELVGRRPEELAVEVPEDHAPLPFSARQPIERAEIWLRRADGDPACIVASAIPIPAAPKTWRGARGVCRDVTEARRRDVALERARNRERLLTRIVRTIRDEVEPENILSVAAEATARQLASARCTIHRYRDAWGFEPAAAFGDTIEAAAVQPVLEKLAEGTALATAEVAEGTLLASASRYRHKVNGAILLWRPREGGAWADDDRTILAGVADQLGIAIEQIENHEKLRSQSRTDALTGLLNRRGFIDDLERRLNRQSRDCHPASLIYVDLDNFKPVNDMHGHKRGDELLRAVARMLVEVTRPGDLVARVGGDEFAIWLEGGDAAVAESRSRAILEAMTALTEFSSDPARPVGVSLGVAIYEPGSGEDLDSVFARADGAMYVAKRSGKGTVRVAGKESAETTTAR